MSNRISAGAGIGILAVVAALGIGGGFFVVKSSAKKFAAAEAEMPESAISTYLEQVKSQDYEKIYEDSLVVAPHLNSKDDYVAKLQSIYSGVDTGKIEYAPDTTDTSKYKLYSDKKYLATLDLMQASDGSWLASTEFSGDQNYTVEVPTGLQIQVNGLDVDASYQTATDTVASNFTQLTDQSAAPHVDRYQFNNMLGAPAITVVGQDGYTTLKDVLSDTLFVGKQTTDAALAQEFTNDAVIFASFPTQDGTLAAIGNVSITDSDFYSRISSMQNTWFSDHYTSQFSNVAATNIIQQSDTTMVGYVTFDYYAEGERSRTWHGGYQMTFMNVNGSWKVAGLGIDNELNPAKEAIPTQG
jgi:hypothetical protein